LRTAVFAAALLTVGTQFLEYHGWFAGPEGRILDFLLGRGSRKTASASPIAVVEIDDAAYASCFNSTSPLDPSVVGSLVKEVAVLHPTVIGVDILTDAPRYSSRYQSMAVEFRSPRRRIIWISGAEKSHFEVAPFYWWLFGSHNHLIVKPTAVLGYEPGELIDHPEIAWGLSVFPPDDDAGLRRFPRKIEASADPQTSVFRESRCGWARIVAEEYCKGTGNCHQHKQAADEIFLSYDKDPPTEFKLSQLASCAAPGTLVSGGARWQEFTKTAPGKMVLIGGTFGSSRDFYATPNGRVPGLLINAYAAQAEIDGDFIQETHRPVAVVFDFLIGCFIGLVVFSHQVFKDLREKTFLKRWAGHVAKNELRYMILGSLILLVAVAGFMLGVFGRGYVLSFTAMAVGVVIHQLVEIWLMRPQHAPSPKHSPRSHPPKPRLARSPKRDRS
jgi:hypothetical protein